MTHAAITVENLRKAYRIGVRDEAPDTLMGAMQGMLRAPWKNWKRLARLNTFRHQEESDDLFWALKDVSFEVREGEVIGIIGRNGAGKSTLLKILSRITEPTRGRAVIRGRVSSLLEVGTGFHPDLSGRDNVYMNGTILGMSKREIDRKFDEIVNFSGVEKFLDTQIKHYSSGMKVRLAFAVAAHLEPEILIIDEVLAVGDLSFQRKCLGKMRDISTGGRTVLFVSHNMAAVESLCSRCVMLEAGTVSSIGLVCDVISAYRSTTFDSSDARSTDRNRTGALFRDVVLLDPSGKPTNAIPVGRPLWLRISIHPNREFMSPRIGIGIDDDIEGRQLTLRTPASRDLTKILDGPCEIDCRVEHCPLRPGTYTVKLSASQTGQRLDVVSRALRFTVVDGELFDEGHGYHSGACVASATWEILPKREFVRPNGENVDGGLA